jgi:hypothetical protein
MKWGRWLLKEIHARIFQYLDTIITFGQSLPNAHLCTHLVCTPRLLSRRPMAVNSPHRLPDLITACVSYDILQAAALPTVVHQCYRHSSLQSHTLLRPLLPPHWHNRPSSLSSPFMATCLTTSISRSPGDTVVRSLQIRSTRYGGRRVGDGRLSCICCLGW